MVDMRFVDDVEYFVVMACYLSQLLFALHFHA
jgi:hypothetical protein